MKCVVLLAPGETIEGLAEFQQLGFSVQSYSVSQEEHLLRDVRGDEFRSFMGVDIGSLDKPYVRSLRISFAKMLLDPAFEGDDYIIFGESDATPTVKAEVLKPIIERELAAHPETDVFRLFLEVSFTPSDEPSCPQHLQFETLQPSPRTRNSVYVWGTHALLIPARSRQKVADIFMNWRLPIDCAIEAACSEKKLTMRFCRHNLFYQKPRTTTADITKMFSWRKRKMALCMASYKRPVDLQRQIFSMMNQSYDKDFFHLFVAVKGISEFHLNTFIIPQFKAFIEAGRLTIRYFPNSHQLANLLDCTRGLDVSEYELFLKIDDDDFYSRDYLSTINEFYTTIPQHYSCFFHDATWKLFQYGGITTPGRETLDYSGPSLVMSREVMHLVKESETNPQLIRRTMAWGGGMAHSSIAYMEDNFIHRLMQMHGCSNIAPFVRQKGMAHFIMYQSSTPSVMRGGYIPREMYSRKDVAQADAPKEDVLYLRHPAWSDTLRVYGDTAFRISDGNQARVKEFAAARLTLKWNDWGEESFDKQLDGSYMFQHQN